MRRKYLENGPCQPRTCNFPSTQIEEKTIQEGFSRNGLMSLEVDLNIVNKKIEHIIFVVSCSEKRRMQDIKHLLLRVGMVITEKRG